MEEIKNDQDVGEKWPRRAVGNVTGSGEGGECRAMDGWVVRGRCSGCGVTEGANAQLSEQ